MTAADNEGATGHNMRSGMHAYANGSEAGFVTMVTRGPARSL